MKATTQLYVKTQAKVLLPGVLQGDTYASFPFVIVFNSVLRQVISEGKEDLDSNSGKEEAST